MHMHMQWHTSQGTVVVGLDLIFTMWDINKNSNQNLMAKFTSKIEASSFKISSHGTSLK